MRGLRCRNNSLKQEERATSQVNVKGRIVTTDDLMKSYSGIRNKFWSVDES